ncbi:hypothetical protein C8A00DRAFT_29476 [Chaetomidium leptoderma]|uniref:Uncharacterized protein n=1 Tax=Chaetomidium leptoderma TaxID=669021 RepID=A0AAN6VUF5_9PEZI|nr:hypothetical protein C8A00DRAFT_29476 [Chaetomidium leptoderma]
MGRLGPLTSQGLGRSPYDDVVLGEGPEDPRGLPQLYDERGRPINPETKRINRDVIRSHNEVMMVIGVAEPENGIAEAQIEAALKHRQYEDRIGRRLLLAGGVLETAAIWGVNGMRQRILLYKPYSQTTFYGMFQLAWSQQSLASFLFGGLPSFLASTVLEQLAVVPGSKKYPVIQYATTYIRLHLAIYTFFQRTGIIPFSRILPNWRFFIPGTSISPIQMPPLPTSFRPRSLFQWLGAFALGAAPFAGFYLYTKFYSLITRTLRFKIHRLLPRPYNANRRRYFPEGSLPSGSEYVPLELRPGEPLDPTPTTSTTTTTATERSPGSAPLRRQSTISLRGSGNSNESTSQPTPGGPRQDDFASDDEETEVISATLISFDVEATDPTTPDQQQQQSTSTNGGGGGGGGGGSSDTAPTGVWSAELRPNLADSSRNPSGSGSGSGSGGVGGGGGNGNGGCDHPHHHHHHHHAHEPVYRENVLTRLPAILATDVLAITPARLLMTPFAAAVWLGLARPYMARLGLSLEGVVSSGSYGGGAGGWWWWLRWAGLGSRGAMVNLLGLELLLAVLHGEAWAVVMLAAERFRYSEEEWNEREGVGEGEGEGEGGRDEAVI